MSALSVEQRSRLVAAKLTALVRAHVTTEGGGGSETPVIADAAPLPIGAGLVADSTAWVFLDGTSGAGLGPALAWAERRGAAGLAVIVDTPIDAAVVARRAAAFALPVAVWSVEGTRLVPVSPGPAAPVSAPDPLHLEAAALLVDVGADVVVEHGVVSGEVCGLEVARVVTVDGRAVVQPGVGRNDRDGHAILLGATPLDDDAALRSTLERVVADVRRHRSGVGADHHPLGRLARSRWLRHAIARTPEVVGADHLEPTEPISPRVSVDDDGPALATGVTVTGQPLVVACSASIDLDVIPVAADARSLVGGPDARLVVVVPHRYVVPATRRLARQLLDPAELVVVGDDWYVTGRVTAYPAA